MVKKAILQDVEAATRIRYVPVDDEPMLRYRDR
jgi:hypothetical protein